MKKEKCASTRVPRLLGAPETQLSQLNVGTDLRTKKINKCLRAKGQAPERKAKDRGDWVESYLFEQ